MGRLFYLLGVMLAGFATLVAIPAGQAQTVTATVATGAGSQPYAVAVNPVTNRTYVLNPGTNSITVISGATNQTSTITDTNATLAVAVAVNPVTNKIYVANEGTNNVTVIDGATNTYTEIAAGNLPSAIAVNTLLNEVYVANSGDGTVTVLQGATGGTDASFIATVTVGAGPSAIAVNPITNRIFVTNYTSNSVSVISGSSNMVLTSPAVGTHPLSIAVNPVTNKIYVANNGSGNVSIIDGTTNTASSPISTGTNPYAIAVNPVTNKVYVTNEGSGTVTVIDSANGNGTTTLEVQSQPYGIAINPVTNMVYVANYGSANVTVIVGAALSNSPAAGVAGSANVGSYPRAVAINPVTNKIYVANSGGATVTVFDGATNSTLTGIPTAVNPISAAVNPVTNKVYVANFGSSSVTVIDPTNINNDTSVTVGAFPYAVAVNPLTNKVYVANNSGNTVSVIDPTNSNNVIATVPVAGSPTGIAVNTVTNRVYVASYSGATMIDGNNNYAPTAIGVSGHPVAVAINQVTNKIYMADGTNDDISVIDGATSVATTLTNASLLNSNGIAVNTVTNMVYVASMGSFNTNGSSVPNTGTLTIINGATSSTAASVAGSMIAGTESFAVAVNEITNKIYVANKDGNNVAVIDANNSNNLVTVTNPNPNALAAWTIAINEATNKIYVANTGTGMASNPGNVTVIDGATNTVTTVTDPTALGPVSIAVNSYTGQIFVANQYSNSVTQITEQQQSAIAITPGIGTLSGNLTNTSNPTFTFSATNTFTSSGTVSSVLYQVDSWQGAWTAATNQSGNTFTATTASLNPGFHILYAYGTDGEAGTSTITGLQSSPLIGNIAAYGFLVTAQSQIVQTTPTINWPTPATITYGTALSGTQLDATASANGSSLSGTFVYTPAAGTVLNAGNQTLSVTFTPTDNIDFKTVTTTVNLVVNKVVSTINWANPSPITYGTPLSGTQLNATVTFNGPTGTGTLVYAPVSGTVLNPGNNQTLSAQFTPTDTIDYTTANVSVSINVTQGTTLTAPTVTASVTTGTAPDAEAVNPATNTIYVANASTNNVTVINGLTNATTTVGVGTQPSAIAANPATNMVYVTNQGSSNVSVISGATNAVTATIPVGGGPVAVAVNPATNTIYVVNQTSGTVSVINGVTNTVTTVVSVGNHPVAVAVNPATNLIYVANQASNTVSVINGGTNGVSATVTDPNAVAPTAVAVDPATNKIYVANEGTTPNFVGTVTVINGSNNTFTNLSAGTEPIAVSVNVVTNKVFVVNNGSSSVTEIDGASNSTISLSVGTSPYSAGVDPVTNKIYVVSRGTSPAFAGTVTVIDGASNTSVSVNAGTNSQAVAVNPVTDRIYVANSGGANVTVLDGETNSIATIGAGTGPQAVAINPVTNKIYVANFSTANPGTVTVIDGITGNPSSISVGNNPYAMAVNPITNKVYVANYGGNTITVIDAANGNATTPVTVGTTPLSVAVNPVTNKIYVANYGSATVSVVDANNGYATTPVTISGGHPYYITVNPVTDQIYVSNDTTSSVTVIDGATNNATQIAVSSATSLSAVNSATNKIYVINTSGNVVTVINGATNTVSATVGVGTNPSSIAVNSATNKIYVTNSGSANISVIDGSQNTTASTITVAAGTTPLAVAVNKATNKIYIANSGSNNVTEIDGASNTPITLTDPNVFQPQPSAIAVNPVTNQIYVANYNTNNVSAITDNQAQTVAITTTIAPLTGNQTTNLTPTFNFTASNTLTSAAVDNVFYQLDSWTGPWTAATNNGSGSFSATPAAQVLPGFHILYAYATDGQEAGSNITGLQSAPLTGSVKAYGFMVTPVGAGASPTSLTFPNQPVTTPSASQTVTLTNAPYSPTLTFSVTFSGTNASDFSETAGDGCSALGGLLAQNSSCTIGVTFTPSHSGTRTASMIITDNSDGVAGTTQTITLTGTGTGNLSPVIAWSAPAAITYGTALSGTQLNATASFGGTQLTGQFVYTPAAGTVLGAGANQTLSVTFNPDDTADYKSVTQTVQITVNRATLTVTASNATRAYGQNNPTFTAGYSGFVNSDTQSVLSGVPSLTTTATSASPVTTYTITAAQGSLAASNYTFSFVNGTLTVTKATPTLTWGTPAAINYGTAISSTQLNATATFNGNTVGGSFVYTPASGTVLTAGTQPLSVTFTPTDTTDLTTATTGVSLQVNQATPTVTWTAPASISYGTMLSSTQLNATATLNGSAVAGGFVYTPAAGTIPNAGNDTLSVTFTPSDATDIKAVTQTTQIVVTQVTPTITWATPAAITYGTALNGTQLDAVVTYNGSALPGTFAYSPAAGTVLGAGNQALSVVFTPTDSIDYKQVNTSTTLVVNSAPTTNQGAVIASITVGATPHAIAVNPATNTAYVVNQGSNNVSVVNGATNTTTTVTVGSQPSAVAVNPVTNKTYVANYADKTVTVIDAANNTSLVNVGTNPIALAVNSATNKIYVADQGSNDVMVIDGVTSSTSIISTGSGSTPSAIAVNPSTGNVYVADYGNGQVTVIDASNNATPVTVGTNPFAIAVNPVTNKVYVANFGSNNVTVIDGSNNTATVGAGTGPNSVAVNPITGKAYVANSGSHNVTVIDGSNNATLVSAGTNPFAVAVDTLTNQVYVTNQGSNNFTVIDGNNNPTNISAGTNPGAVGINPVTNKIYIANSGGANVSVVDGSTNTIANFGAGTQPQAVAVNPVTNNIYVANFGSNNVTVIGGSSTITVPTGSNPYAIAINPLTNMIYVANNGSSNVTVINGATNTVVTTVPVGSTPYDIAVNPATNKIYVANFVDLSVTVIDGATNIPTRVQDPNAKNPIALAVDSVTNQIYVVNVGDGTHQGTVTDIDGATNNTTTINGVGVSPWAIAVNPVTNKIYVGHYLEQDVMVIDGTNNSVTTVPTGANTFFIKVNSATNKIYVVNKDNSSVTVLDGATNAPTTVTVGTNPFALAVNKVTNKIYVANYGSSNISVIDGATNYTTTLTDPNVSRAQPAAVAVNPETDQVYVANSNASSVTVITEEQVASIPVVANITPLTNNQTTSVAPIFNFTSSNTLTSGPATSLYYQVDTWEGPWSAAISQGSGAFSGSTSSLQTGLHVLYAYATEGQAATSTATGVQSSPLIGNITAYEFLVPAGATPPAGVNLTPGTWNFGNQQKLTTGSPLVATLSNGTSNVLHFSYATSGTNAGDFVETTDSCSTVAGQLAAGSSCSIALTFTPANTGAETATLTVTDDANGVSGSTQTVSLSGTGTGNQKPTITWNTPAPITYGTALGNNQLNATASYNGTSLTGTFVYSPVAGTVLTPGTPTLSVTFTPTDTVDYAGAVQTVQLSVGPATLNVSASPATRAYGAANPTFTPSYTGFVGTDTAAALTGAPAFSTTATTTSAIGSYPITVTQGTLAAANYTFNFVPGSLTVTTATPTINWPSPAPIGYGTQLGSTQLDATATFNGSAVTGTFVYNPVAGTVLPAGTQTLSVTFTPTGAGAANFTTATGSTTISVSAVASFVGTDTITQGNWQGVYGSDGYFIANSTKNLPSYANFTVNGESDFTWSSTTTDPRALQAASGSGRIASAWYNNPGYSFDLNFTDGNQHAFALYALDWDQKGRAETIQILDANTNAVLDTENVTSFGSGTYLVWNISGHVKINVTLTASGTNAALSGAFFGNSGSLIRVGVSPQTANLGAGQQQQFTATVNGTSNQNVTWSLSPNVGTLTTSGNTATYTAPQPLTAGQVTIKALSAADDTTTGSATINLTTMAVANFLSSDTITQGSWQGSYGADGYSIPNSVQSIPSYATFGVSNQTNYTWAGSTTDPRAVQVPGGSSRIASAWCCGNPTSTFDVNFTDGNAHQFALYALDWDNIGRAETVQIFDAGSNTQIDSRNISGFGGGIYLVWNISGHVKIVVTLTSGPNSVVNGAFFGGAGAGGGPLSVAVSPQTVTLSATQQQPFTATVNGTSNQNVTWSINPNVGTLTTSGNATTYTAPATITTNQSVTITALAAKDGTTTGTATINLTAGSGGSGTTASFVSTDTATGGSWQGVYGADGYAIANSVKSIPSYATFSVSGEVDYTWQSSTTDSRALSLPSGGRIASAWCCGNPNYTFDVNFTDGNTHQFALYALDWDNGARAETIQVLNASTNAVLDTRSVSNFVNSLYLVWNISGHVKINVTWTGGSNSALSGAFFGGTSTTGGGGVSVSVSPKTMSLSATQQQQYMATVTGTTNQNVTWSINPNVGTLTTAGNTATYTAPATITTNQSVTITALSADDGTTTGTATINLMTGSGGSGTAASFVSTDTATGGNWQGVYGADGYAIANATQSIPSYATFAVSGQVNYTWQSSTVDTRALQLPAGGRVASAWCCGNPTYSIDLNFTDGNTHQFALYALDWDTGVRAETIQVLNATTNAVLDTRSVSSFVGGEYLIWNISGHVKINVTWTGGSNSALSGAFFGGAGTTGGGGTISVGVTPQTTSLSATQQQQYIATVTGTTNQNVTWSINPNVGTLATSGNTATYTAPATITTNQSVTITALAAQDGTTTGTATINLTAATGGSGTAATFVSTDTATGGSWQGVYGADGYAIANSAKSIPSYATFSVSGELDYTWMSSTADTRALSLPSGGRIASAWCCANPSYTFDVNFTDGNTHQFALYALDWDNGARAETIQVLNASTNAVLDTRSVSSFANGMYLIWNISGHVKINVTWTGGSNQAISGAFFGGGSSGGGGVSVSVSPKTMSLSASQQQQYLATVTGTTNQNVTWSINPNVGTLTTSGNTATYTAPATITTNQSVTITALAAQDGTTTGTGTINLTTTSGGGTAATFLSADSSTSGNWTGVYGADGYAIANSTQNLPSYATLAISGQTDYTWSSTTIDTRALQFPSGGRIASTWYGTTYSIDLNLTDGNTHQFALYALDWDAGSRAETIQIVNAATNAVLDTRNISNFVSGVYVIWNISGHVKINVTWTGGSNAVLSGAFFK